MLARFVCLPFCKFSIHSIFLMSACSVLYSLHFLNVYSFCRETEKYAFMKFVVRKAIISQTVPARADDGLLVLGCIEFLHFLKLFTIFFFSDLLQCSVSNYFIDLFIFLSIKYSIWLKGLSVLIGSILRLFLTCIQR